jgi:hypothetical protein
MENQKLVGISSESKEKLDKYYKLKGFNTRSKYLESLIDKDTRQEVSIEVNPEFLN